MVIRNNDFHDKIHEFKDVLSSTKVKHENWENKKTTIISILTSKLENINEILNDQHFEFEIKENNAHYLPTPYISNPFSIHTYQ